MLIIWYNDNTMIFIHKNELESTNKYAKELAISGADEFTVVIADRQTGGYGRKGRSFSSPNGSGLYMSIILRPDISTDNTLLITPAAAVAVCRAIESFCKKECSIKWVNDIYIADKKVCGILAETGFSGGAYLDYVILGIGINICEPEGGFDSSIKDIAGAICNSCTPASKEKLASMIVEEFKKYYSTLTEKAFWEEYKNKNFICNTDITVIQGDKQYSAYALDIDSDFKLLIKNEENDIIALDCGEVSVRRSV